MLKKILVISFLLFNCIIIFSPNVNADELLESSTREETTLVDDSNVDSADIDSEVQAHLESISNELLYLIILICFICLCVFLYIVFKSFTLF
nr:MAG TPA: Glycine rich protein family [Inoviridae sp.]